MNNFKWNDHYREIEDQLFDDEIYPTLPRHLQLLSILAGVIDGALVEIFDLEAIREAINKEATLTEFHTTIEELTALCTKLKDHGYLSER